MIDAGAQGRILTLVFTDLVDSTALKMQQGDERVGELIARHRAHVAELASAGRIIDWAGDGCFLTFETPSAAVAFALRLQQTHADEPDLPAVRAGLHMGEVSERTGPGGAGGPARVEGLAVDLAARICGLARPRQVLMSSSVADSARQRLDVRSFSRPIAWRSHGAWSLKGFDKPIDITEVGYEGETPFQAPDASEKATRAQPAAPVSTDRGVRSTRIAVAMILLTIIAAGITWWGTSRAPAALSIPVPSQETAQETAQEKTQQKKAIAVLPFVNMSSDAENEYFSDGITEDLITALSKVSGLQVAARTSSFAFKGKNQDIREIGDQLHVSAVLEGSVAKVGERVRITAQLINAADGYHLWSERYDRELKDVFAIRSEIAQTVADALQVTLLAGEREGLGQKPTEDLEAYQLYLKARYATATISEAGMHDAIRFLEEAVARDPNYALAHLGMAYYYFNHTDNWFAPNESFPRVRDAAETALRLDPSLAEAHTFLGAVHWWYHRDDAAAQREFQTALAMQPNLPLGHTIYGAFLVANGHFDEGINESRRAVALDPLSAEMNAWLGINLYIAGRTEEAVEQLQSTIAREPYPYASLWLARAYARLGRFPEAIAALSEVVKVETGAEYVSALGRIHADAGNTAEASAVLDQMRKQAPDKFVPGTCLAIVQIGLKDTDGAIASLERGVREHSYYVPWLKFDPFFDPLRADPRFAALLKKARLE